jgi:hypothetical protein
MQLPYIVEMHDSYSELLFMQTHLVFFGMTPDWQEDYEI